jgi:hypothetical protein
VHILCNNAGVASGRGVLSLTEALYNDLKARKAAIGGPAALDMQDMMQRQAAGEQF